MNQAVKRNIRRFPEDFMFQLNNDEWVNLRSQFVTFNKDTLTNDELANLRSQIVTSSSNYGGRRYMPYAFTEQESSKCNNKRMNKFYHEPARTNTNNDKIGNKSSCG